MFHLSPLMYWTNKAFWNNSETQTDQRCWYWFCFFLFCRNSLSVKCQTGYNFKCSLNSFSCLGNRSWVLYLTFNEFQVNILQFWWILNIFASSNASKVFIYNSIPCWLFTAYQFYECQNRLSVIFNISDVWCGIMAWCWVIWLTTWDSQSGTCTCVFFFNIILASIRPNSWWGSSSLQLK